MTNTLLEATQKKKPSMVFQCNFRDFLYELVIWSMHTSKADFIPAQLYKNKSWIY